MTVNSDAAAYRAGHTLLIILRWRQNFLSRRFLEYESSYSQAGPGKATKKKGRVSNVLPAGLSMRCTA